MAFKSDLALLDVTKGRVTLAKRIKKGARIPVVIRGVINGQWGNDDGVSTEFTVDISSVKELKRA